MSASADAVHPTATYRNVMSPQGTHAVSANPRIEGRANHGAHGVAQRIPGTRNTSHASARHLDAPRHDASPSPNAKQANVTPNAMPADVHNARAPARSAGISSDHVRSANNNRAIGKPTLTAITPAEANTPAVHHPPMRARQADACGACCRCGQTNDRHGADRDTGSRLGSQARADAERSSGASSGSQAGQEGGQAQGGQEGSRPVRAGRLKRQPSSSARVRTMRVTSP